MASHFPFIIPSGGTDRHPTQPEYDVGPGAGLGLPGSLLRARGPQHPLHCRGQGRGAEGSASQQLGAGGGRLAGSGEGP